jgi:hypothetical protein
MTQLDLFDVGERREVDVPPFHPRSKRRVCTPDVPGSGPPKILCKGCRHLRRLEHNTRTYLKCGLMQHHWTHGPASDIKAGWPACSKFAPTE